jgi:ribonuclease Z
MRRVLAAYARLYTAMRYHFVDCADLQGGGPGPAPGPDGAAVAAAAAALRAARLATVRVDHCAHAFGLIMDVRVVARGEEQGSDPPGVVVAREGGREPGAAAAAAAALGGGDACAGPRPPPPPPGCVRLAFSGDTRPCPALVAAARGAALLVHEATFEDDLKSEADAKKHSTTGDAVAAGAAAGAARTLLTHFSQRYPKVPVIAHDLGASVGIAFDLLSLDLADAGALPALTQPLRVLFEGMEEKAAGGGGKAEE